MLTNTLFFPLFYTGYSFSHFRKSSDTKKNLPWKNGPRGRTETQVGACPLLPRFTHTHPREKTASFSAIPWFGVLRSFIPFSEITHSSLHEACSAKSFVLQLYRS